MKIKMNFTCAHFFCILCSFVSLCAIGVRAEPQRIVSLNLCVDQLLLKLVPKGRIASVTYLSTNPQLSDIAHQLDGLHINHGLAEEIVPLQPDLIIAGEFGASDAVNLLTHLGYPVERVIFPRTLDEITTHITDVGELVGAQTKAAEMVAHIHARLAQADLRTHQQLQKQLQQQSEQESEQRTQKKITAIWYTPNGVVAGSDTLEHELMMRAGFRNLAAEKGVVSFAQMDLEQLIMAEPEMIIVEGGYRNTFSVAGEYVQHPALAKKSRIVELPAALSVCSAPVVADVLNALSEQSVQ